MQSSEKINDQQNDFLSWKNPSEVSFDIHFTASQLATQIGDEELALIESILPDLLLQMIQDSGHDGI